MVCSSFAASGPGQFAVSYEQLILLSAKEKKKILKVNVQPSVALKLKHTWVYGAEQWLQKHWQSPPWTAQIIIFLKADHFGWLSKVKVQLRYFGMTLNRPFMLENPQCGWIKVILQRRVGKNSSTLMWKTCCQLSQLQSSQQFLLPRMAQQLSGFSHRVR